MLSNKQIDIKFGLQAENDLYDILKEKFDKNLVRSTDKYSRYDYYSDSCIVELKTRRNTKDKYPTTMIGLNKFDDCLRDCSKDYYFVFNFTDGVWYWKFDKDEYDEFEKRIGGRNDRGYDESSMYLYIPVNMLIKL